jgi:cysteine-rich repeat protein/surface protein
MGHSELRVNLFLIFGTSLVRMMAASISPRGGKKLWKESCMSLHDQLNVRAKAYRECLNARHVSNLWLGSCLSLIFALAACEAGQITNRIESLPCQGNECDTPTNSLLGSPNLFEEPTCGNAIREEGESCDDGINDGSYGGCTPNCRWAAMCGDAVVDDEEECDEGEGNTSRIQGNCRVDCTFSTCGDNVVEGREQCDDGNVNDGDGCSAQCTNENLDCAGIWSGTATLDNCNICDICDSDCTQDCTQDRKNAWGGTAVDDNCGTCDSDAGKLLEIKNWGPLDISTSSAFCGCTNLTSSATDKPVVSSTSLAFTFRGAQNFNGDLSGWDTGAVTNMREMFHKATSFNQPLGGSDGWDTSAVTSMGGMFYGATAFNQDISAWDVSQVTDMTNMFFTAPLPSTSPFAPGDGT